MKIAYLEPPPKSILWRRFSLAAVCSSKNRAKMLILRQASESIKIG